MKQPLTIGTPLIELDWVDSTNAAAARMLEKKEVQEGTVLTARYQDSGKGLSGNSWFSDEGLNLLLSVILVPEYPEPRFQFFLNQSISLAVLDAVVQLTGICDVFIKWPNDLIIGDKKVAGMLIENTIQGNRFRYAIAGIGLNINQKNFPDSLKQASSLSLITGHDWDLKEVRDTLFHHLTSRYEQLQQRHVAALQRDYMKHLFRSGEESQYLVAGKRRAGKIVGITSSGRLILEISNRHEVFGFKEIEMVM